MKIRYALTMLSIVCGLATFPALAQYGAAPSTAPDNTRVNTRDRDANEPTSDQAENNKSDLDVMKSIRKSIVSDKSLSTYAHNVKVIAMNGKVTLKGPVKSDAEIQTIEAKARDVAGNGNVSSELSVAH